MMGWIEIRPKKLLNQNFVRQGPPAKCNTRRFRFISLICITPLLVKLAYFLPPKKIWCDTYVPIFFSARTKYVRTCARAELRRSELFLSCFQNFFFVSSVYSVPSQLLARICRLDIAMLTPPRPSRCHCRCRVANATTALPADATLTAASAVAAP